MNLNPIYLLVNLTLTCDRHANKIKLINTSNLIKLSVINNECLKN